MSQFVSKLSREQRIRKQAEVQSLYNALANQRGREQTYIDASAAIPQLSINQINEIRRRIETLEAELFAAKAEENDEVVAHRFYQEAFEAEQAGAFSKAVSLYKKAARYDHQDADAAVRSLRYRVKRDKQKSLQTLLPAPNPLRNRLLVGVATVLICTPLAIFAFYQSATIEPGQDIGQAPTLIVSTPTPVTVQLIVPNTATPLPTATPTVVSPPTTALQSTTVASGVTPTPGSTSTPSPTPTVVLRPAPRIIGPNDGLVWLDGAIVFEFETLDLDYDELYCLDTLRGYDQTNTENWSFPPTGSEEPTIVIQASVFRIAKAQGMECIVWSAGIGRGSCNNLISELTPPRVIGLPRPCNLN